MATVDFFPGPPNAPTIAGENLTVSTLLNTPPLVKRVIEDLTESRFVSSRIFGPGPNTNAGAVAYDQVTANDRFLTRDVKEIAPGAEFPLLTDEVPTPKIASVAKHGGRIKIPNETVIRNNRSATTRAFTKLSNTIIRKSDRVAMQALEDAPTLEYPFDATWAASDINAILAGLLEAREMSTTLEMGYYPDTVIINQTLATRLLIAAIATDKKLFGENGQEDVVRSGYLGRILDMDFWVTEELDNDEGWMVQAGIVGDIADETPLNTKAYWWEPNESWYVQGSRSFVPYVTDPYAAIHLQELAA